MGITRADKGKDAPGWKSVSDIPRFPFNNFSELRRAVADRDFNLGVDPLAAAEWSESSNTGFKKVLITALSLLLVLAALASLIAAVALGDYWLLFAAPIQVFAFYVSHPASPFRKWVTIAGVASLIVFIDLLFNQFITAATLVAYAGLTFAAVRAAAYVTNSAFRKALLADEDLFLLAYANRACSLREKRSDRIYMNSANRPA